MTTKRYLGQFYNLDQRIKDKIEEAQKWYDIATDRSVHTKEVNVQVSGSKERMADAITFSVDCQNEAEEIAIMLSQKRHNILKQIDSMELELHYNILRSMYVKQKSLNEIAVEQHYSYKQIKRYYEDAIKAFEKKYGHLYLSEK